MDGKPGMDNDIIADGRPVVDDVEANLLTNTIGINSGYLVRGEIVRVTLNAGHPHWNCKTHGADLL
jgi:hypothetical protein